MWVSILNEADDPARMLHFAGWLERDPAHREQFINAANALEGKTSRLIRVLEGVKRFRYTGPAGVPAGASGDRATTYRMLRPAAIAAVLSLVIASAAVAIAWVWS